MSTKAHNFETYTKNLFKELNSKFQIKQESKKLFNDIICKIIKDIIIDYIMSLKDCKTINNSNILEIFEDTSYFTEETMVIIKPYVNEKLDNYEKYQSELEKNNTQSKMKLEKHVKLIFPITKTENIIRKELKDIMNKSPRFDKRSGVFISITAIIQCLIEILITKSCDFTKEQNKVQVSAEYICKTIENNTDYDSLYGSYTYEEKITKLSKQKTLASNSDKKCVKNKKSSSDDESADESDAEFESNSKTKSVKKTVKKQINKDDVTSANENSDSDSKDKSCSKTKQVKKQIKNSEMPITKKETTIFDPPLLNSKESTINQVVYNSSESDNDNEYSDVSD